MTRSLFKYGWTKSYPHQGIDPDTIGRYLEAMGERITVDDILHHATSQKSPLHKLFTWNDSKAAQAYRRWQARQLANQLVLVDSKGKRHGRAFWSIKGAYVHTSRAVGHDITLKAHKELAAWCHRYAEHKPLSALNADVFYALQRHSSVAVASKARKRA